MQREPNTINKQLKMIQKTFEERRNKHLSKYNLTSSQQEILFYLGFHEGEPIHQREIEKWFRLKNPTVTGILNRLEEKGFIVRKTKENDKRFRMIELTEKSRCLMQEMCEEMWQMDDKIYSCMTAEERSQLSGLLERILNSLSELE
ncbi:HTH-type transcriptional regulator MhqR [Lachnospiraceae bacterium]|jgi:MarR family transcriptional repressor of mepA|uniref:MarR family winged helix-turn-helix transcriptional regulator n=1 Tax=Candidatus Merdisoma sp. JLR.KK011 TaxID=3114299 RepID=UPI0014335846|nr:HTH-type transcriptional regulator MhqR [Lachnospiraceae bacterium]